MLTLIKFLLLKMIFEHLCLSSWFFEAILMKYLFGRFIYQKMS